MKKKNVVKKYHNVKRKQNCVPSTWMPNPHYHFNGP